MKADHNTGARPWPAHRLVLLAGLALAAFLTLASVAIFLQFRTAVVQEQQKRNALFARVLEDFVTRSVDTAALSLAGIGSDLNVPLTATSEAISANLRQTLVSLPPLRSLAVVRDRKSTRLNSSHCGTSRMPSSA